jgi:transposase
MQFIPLPWPWWAEPAASRLCKEHLGWSPAVGSYDLKIVKRKQRAFKITGLTWIVERNFAWLGRYRRLSKDYEFRVQTSEAMIDITAARLSLNRLVPA